MEFRLDAGSGVATYRQLADQVRQALRLGILNPGDQLPTVREVVASIAINPNTVLKAYKELEQQGLAEGRPGQGTFILRSLSSTSRSAQLRLRKRLASWLTEARRSGFDEDAIRALIDSVLHEKNSGIEDIA
jgi:GntR family transcriptional regulator